MVTRLTAWFLLGSVFLALPPAQAKPHKTHKKHPAHAAAKPATAAAQPAPPVPDPPKSTNMVTVMPEPSDPAPPAPSPLAAFDQRVKACDHWLYQADLLQARMNGDADSIKLWQGLADDQRERERRLKAHAAQFGLEYNHDQFDALEQDAKADEAQAAKAAQDLTQAFAEAAGFLRLAAPLSRVLHADPLFKAHYFIGDRVIHSRWEPTDLWKSNGLTGMTDDDVRYIESSEPGLGRPAAELSVAKPVPGITPKIGVTPGYAAPAPNRRRFPTPFSVGSSPNPQGSH